MDSGPPADAVRYSAGVDWGWKNPAAILVGALDSRGVLHIVEEIYGTGLTMDGETGDPEHDARDLVALARDAARRYPIELWYCDPAEPRSIEKFRRADLAAKEGYNKSILVGVQAVNSRIRTRRLKVSRSCAGLIKEAGLYRYPTPEERRVLNTENPLDQDNHSCAALRYLVCGVDRTAISLAGWAPMRAADVEQDEPEQTPAAQAQEQQNRYPGRVTPPRPPAERERPLPRESIWEEQQGWTNVDW